MKRKITAIAMGAALVGAPLAGANTANAAESYTLSESQTEHLYDTYHGDTTGMKAAQFLAGFIPHSPGTISGFSTEDRKNIEEAYHDDVGVRVTVDMGYTSYDADVDYEPLN